MDIPSTDVCFWSPACERRHCHYGAALCRKLYSYPCSRKATYRYLYRYSRCIRKTPRDKRGVFLHRSNLDLADVERVRAFRAVPDLERDLVALLKLIERNVPELVGVEEKILRAFRRAAHLDEAETFFVLLDDYSIFHTREIIVWLMCIKSVAENRSSIPLLWIKPLVDTRRVAC